MNTLPLIDARDMIVPTEVALPGERLPPLPRPGEPGDGPFHA